LFDSDGIVLLDVLMRLANAGQRRPGMIDELLADEGNSQAVKDSPGGKHSLGRFMRFKQ